MAQFRQSIVGAGSGGSKKKKEEVVQNVQNQQEKSAYVPEPVVQTQQPVVQTQQPTASSQQPVATQQTAATTEQTTTPVQQTITLPKYEPSEAVLQAQALLQQQMASHPGEYTSLWQDQINQQVNQILTRDPFSYDVYADPMYRQYTDQYTRMGQLASMDAMGQAAALTGGYGSSYGQSVGNQAYFNYLNQLNEVVPELQAAARNNYDQEGQAMKDRLSMLTSFENQDYSRYNDQLNQWLTERNYLTDRYETERNNDYSQFADQRNMDYQLQRDAIEDERWQKEWDLSLQKYLASQGSSSSRNDNDTGNDDTGDEIEDVAVEEDTGEYVPGKSVNNVIADVKSLGVSSESEAGKNMIRDVVLQAYNNNQLSNEDAQYLIRKYDL